MQLITLDGARMKSVRETHLYLAAAMRFPVYYGRNLDALHDCLTEFCGDMIVILRHSDAMEQNLGDYAERLLTVFTDAAESSSLRFVIDPA